MDKRFSSIIFDWDGTLAMTLHLWLAGYRHELKKLGFNLSDQIIADDFFYEHDKAAMKYPAVDFGPFNERVRAHVLSHVQQLQTYPGAHEMLEKLERHDIKLSLVSSSSRSLLKEGLERTGLGQFFQTIVAGDDVMRHKPDPEPFNQAVEVAGFSKDTTLILGDSHNDIVAAKASGIASCLFLPEENELFYDFEKLRSTNPDYSIEDLNHFAEVLLS